MPRRKCWKKVEAGRRAVLGRREMLGTVPLAMQSPQMGSNYSDGGVARPTCLSHTNVDRHVLCCPPRGMHMPSEPQSPVLLQATNICQNLTHSAHSNLETKETSDLEVRGLVSPKAYCHLTRKNASCHQTQTNISDIQTLQQADVQADTEQCYTATLLCDDVTTWQDRSAWHCNSARFVFGTYNQADNVFSEESRGSQCTLNALCSLIYAKYSDIHTHQDLDKVLLDGDSLYNKTVLTLLAQGMLKSKLLNFDEIPQAVTVLKKKIIVEKSDVISGVCTQQFATLGLPSLYQSLHTAFQQSSYLLFMIGSVCSAVFKKDEEYYFFDSHSHGQDGMSCPDGKSVLACFQNLEDLVAFMYAVYDSMLIDISSQFDMLPVNMTLASVKLGNQSTDKNITAPGTDTDTCVEDEDRNRHQNMDSCEWKTVSYKKQNKTHLVKAKAIS